ncbi:hypothetical protein EON73_00845 [bacterium]|nr:MAG: hypothetical protein EON73_00845 [bacterium]
MVADVKKTFGFEAELLNFSLLYYNYKNELFAFLKKNSREFEIEFDYTKIELAKDKCFDLISQKVSLTGKLPNLYRYEEGLSNPNKTILRSKISKLLSSPVVYNNKDSALVVISNSKKELELRGYLLEDRPESIPEGHFVLDLNIFVILVRKIDSQDFDNIGIIKVQIITGLEQEFHIRHVLFPLVAAIMVNQKKSKELIVLADLVQK